MNIHRKIMLEEREAVRLENQWPLRSKIEITIRGWPRRQRFGRLTGVDMHRHNGLPYMPFKMKVVLPERFKMTTRCWREIENHGHIMDAMDLEKADWLPDEDMAEISSEDELWDWGEWFYFKDVQVVGPPLPVKLVAPPRKVTL